MQNAEKQGKYKAMLSFLKQDPDNIGLFQKAFDLAIELGHLVEASQMILTRDEHFSLEPLQIYCKSKLALAKQDFEQAKQFCLDLIGRGETNLAIVNNLSWAQFNLGEFQEVIESIKLLGEQKYQYTPLLILECRSLHHLGKIDDAILLGRELVEAPTDSEEVNGLLSLLLLDSGNYSEAESFALKTQQVDRENHEALITLSSIALVHQDAEKAQDILELGENLIEQSGRLMLNLGQVHILNMDFDKAEKSLIKASQLMPQHIGTWHALAWSKLILGKIDDAGSCFQSAYELDRNFAESHGGLAITAIHNNKLEEAEKYIKTALRLDSMCNSARYAESLLLECKGDLKVAQRKLSDIIKNRTTVDGIPILDAVQKLASRLNRAS